MGYIYLEKVYDRVKREALWQVRKYDVELRACMLIVQLVLEQKRLRVSGLG